MSCTEELIHPNKGETGVSSPHFFRRGDGGQRGSATSPRPRAVSGRAGVHLWQWPLSPRSLPVSPWLWWPPSEGRRCPPRPASYPSKFISSDLQGEMISASAPPSGKGLLFWPGSRSPCPVLRASSTRVCQPATHRAPSFMTSFSGDRTHPFKVHHLKSLTSKK